jgi:hypothetical protein
MPDWRRSAPVSQSAAVDSSTDDWRSVIDAFGGWVKAYFKVNSQQLRAHKFGFEHSAGDAVILLDADDLLEPQEGDARNRAPVAAGHIQGLFPGWP